MNYKEMYEQAIERVKIRFGINVAAELFPELAESEDERIRKELIEYIKDQQSSFISAPDCRDKYEEEENNKYNSWIAWLEKQGEQKPAWGEEDEEMIKNMQNDYHNRLGAGIIPQKYHDKVISWLKSLRPQKRIEGILTLRGYQNDSNIG